MLNQLLPVERQKMHHVHVVLAKNIKGVTELPKADSNQYKSIAYQHLQLEVKVIELDLKLAG
jgi:hypothetical protein